MSLEELRKCREENENLIEACVQKDLIIKQRNMLINKTWYKSKRFWTNASLILACVGSVVMGEKTIQGILPELIGSLYAIINLVLATTSEKPLGWSK